MTVPLLKVDGVTVRFGGLTAIANVSFDVEAGELLGLIGPNGAGKTTDRVLAVADDICVLESGRTVWQGNAIDARNDPALTAAYLGLH